MNCCSRALIELRIESEHAQAWKDGKKPEGKKLDKKVNLKNVFAVNVRSHTNWLAVLVPQVTGILLSLMGFQHALRMFQIFWKTRFGAKRFATQPKMFGNTTHKLAKRHEKKEKEKWKQVSQTKKKTKKKKIDGFWASVCASDAFQLDFC